MDYAIQLLLPILGGLLLGNWLHNTFGLSHLWTLLLAILGMVAGLAIMYRRVTFDAQKTPSPKIKKADPTQEKPTQEAHPGVHHQEVLDLYKKIDNEPDENEGLNDFGLGSFLDSDDDTPTKPPRKPPHRDDER